MVAQTMLEQLVQGRTKKLEFRGQSRDSLLEQINSIITSFFPGSWTEGKFQNEHDDYLVYDLSICNTSSDFGIRIIELESKIRLFRTQ